MSARYDRVPLVEGGSTSEGPNFRKYLPLIAFVLGAAAVVGYYEFATVNPAISSTAISPVMVMDTFADPVVYDTQDGSLGELEVARSLLFEAQKQAEDRMSQVRELRAELSILEASASSAQQGLAQCQSQRLPSGASPPASTPFDIDSYRAQRLAATPPNIIECVEATAGGSQEACHLPKSERFAAIGQKGATVWMTGLSGSGKSTIAKALERKLVVELGLAVQNLDGDNVRTGLNRDLGFSPGDRAESVRRVGEVACLFSGGGVITLVTLVSPYRSDREASRQRHLDQGIPFIEVAQRLTES